jgi:glutamyl-tRNA synthetase
MPLHVLLYRAFGWVCSLAINKTDRNGKLSKQMETNWGFPLEWKTEETGYRFLSGSSSELSSALGWNDGTEKEMFTLEKLRPL